MDQQLYDINVAVVGFANKYGRLPRQTADQLENYCKNQAAEVGDRSRFWVTRSGEREPILGDTPAGWSPDDPHYENVRQ